MNILVTGGGGFLGGAIARELHERGDTVTVFGRRPYPHLESLGLQTLRGDVRDAESVGAACAACDAVFHVAAKVGIWGRYRDFYDVNVTGTRNVIAGCRRHGVTHLVVTSSPSVVSGDEPLEGVDESQPYPDRYLSPYARTKAEAEKSVLASNGPDLCTVVLRPHLLWGPGDTQLIPRLLDRARRGRLVQVGDGTNLVDLTYISDAVGAHLCALDRLQPGAHCAGNAYFISQGAPVPLWSWINDLLGRVGIAPVRRRLPYRSARRLGAALETIYRALRIRSEPPMTRFLAGQLAKAHYFSIEGARRDLGYRPRVSMESGLEKLVEWIHAGMPTG